MIIEIDCSPAVLPALFDSNSISPGMVRVAPGGATLELGDMPMEKRHIPGLETFVTIAVTFTSGVAVNMFSNWLYDKLKGDNKVRKLRINRVVVEVESGAIAKVVAESIEVEQRK